MDQRPQQALVNHEVGSYCYITVWCDGQTELPVENCSPTAAEHFLRALQEEDQKIKRVLAISKAMRMTREEWQAYNEAMTCYVCDKDLEGDTIRDHCHITRQYRGAAHNACNLKLQFSLKTTTIPVVFHNLQGYDSHLLMEAISKMEGKVTCIPKSMEKYIPWTDPLHRQHTFPAGLPQQACGSQST